MACYRLDTQEGGKNLHDEEAMQATSPHCTKSSKMSRVLKDKDMETGEEEEEEEEGVTIETKRTTQS